MQFHFIIVGVAVSLLFLGCISNPTPPANNSNTLPAANDSTIVAVDDLNAYIQTLPDPLPGPGDVLEVCGTGSDARDCFEGVLAACGRSTASFWSTSDGQVLDFESSGLDIASLGEGIERCKVRIYVSADSESQFAGTSTTCLLPKRGDGTYALASIDFTTCDGTYVDTLNRSTPVTP